MKKYCKKFFCLSYYINFTIKIQIMKDRSYYEERLKVVTEIDHDCRRKLEYNESPDKNAMWMKRKKRAQALKWVYKQQLKKLRLCHTTS